MALRVGAEDKKKVWIAIACGVALVLVAMWQLGPLFTSSTPSTAPTPAAQIPPAATPAPTTAAGPSAPYAHEAVKVPAGSGLDPTLHPEVMAQAEALVYTGNGRNIFSQNSAPAPVHIEKVKAPIRPVETGPPQPPPPPPIDLKFYGYASANGGPKQVFLLHGDDIFLAHEGDIVDRRYRVVAIHPFSVEVEDLPYHNTQSLPLTQN